MKSTFHRILHPRSRRVRSWLILGVGWLVVLWFHTVLFAAEARIDNVHVARKNGRLVVSALLRNGFGEKTLQELHNGLPKDFYYDLVLKRKQKNFLDEEILAKTLRTTVRYDTLKLQYAVTKEDGTDRQTTTWDDLESMQRDVAKIDRVALAPVDILLPDRRYYVDVQAQMRTARLPFYQEYFLFFIPFLEIDTRWAHSGVFTR